MLKKIYGPVINYYYQYLFRQVVEEEPIGKYQRDQG